MKKVALKAEKGTTIDLSNLIANNPDAVGGVIPAGGKAVVFLLQAFLDKFEENPDSLEVAGEVLSPSWGRKGSPSLTADGVAERKGTPNPCYKTKLIEEDAADDVLDEIATAKLEVAPPDVVVAEVA
jgi:hypothetical protein